MENNEITLSNTNNETYTEFKQTNEAITFDINGKLVIEIRANGECYKNDELITNDIEIFEHLKTFAQKICGNCA